MPKEDKKTDNDDQKKLTDDPAFKEMQKAVKGMALLMQQGQASQSKLQENFNTLMGKLSDPKEDDPKNLDPDNDAINDLDNAGLMRLVVGEVGKVIEDKFDKVNDSISSTNKSVSDSRIALELKEHIVDHPDFMDWKTEISALAKDNPTLSIPRLHSLVRSENPEKATELDGKYKSDGGNDLEPGFLGLMSTGGGFIDDDSDEKSMTKDEALDKAWEETLEQFPAIAVVGDEG